MAVWSNCVDFDFAMAHDDDEFGMAPYGTGDDDVHDDNSSNEEDLLQLYWIVLQAGT
jgi:hypothetical protein